MMQATFSPSVGRNAQVLSTSEELTASKPKRPLSAYNYFFKSERARILASLPVRAQGKPRRSHGKMGFQEMGRVISANWKATDDETRNYFQRLAEEDTRRYKREKKVYQHRRKLAEQKSGALAFPTLVPSSHHEDFEPLDLPVSRVSDPLSGLDEDTTYALLSFFKL